jgi:hypothetical protein
MQSSSGWIEMFRSLGQSLLAVLRAEVEALQEDFRRSGRHLAVGVGLLAAAAAIGFWAAGLLLFVLVVVLAIWLPLWGAALVVLGLAALAALLLVTVARRQLRQLESPIDDVKKRVSDHLDWWQNGLLATPGSALPVAPARSETLGEDLP